MVRPDVAGVLSATKFKYLDRLITYAQTMTNRNAIH
jgi:hypothetical protein